MAAGGHIGNITWAQIDIESCVIPLFPLILAWRIHFWHRFCILTSPTIKIQDGRLRPYWKCNLKVNGHRKCNITFPTKCGIESPFLASFFILMSLNIKIQDGRHLPIPFVSVFSHIIHITCWISHEKLVFSNMCLFPGILHQKLVSSNICWFYMMLLHIFPHWSPRKVGINNFFK